MHSRAPAGHAPRPRRANQTCAEPGLHA